MSDISGPSMRGDRLSDEEFARVALEAVAQSKETLHFSRSATQGDLKNISVQLGELASRLGEIATEALTANPQSNAKISANIAPPERACAASKLSREALEERRALYAEMATALYLQRRSRNAIFSDSNLFSEPAWDILLDLYAAFVAGKQVSVSSACIGSAAPSTTGLRWLGILTEADLLVREHDAEDQRRVLVRLSDKGVSAMERYFDGVLRIQAFG